MNYKVLILEDEESIRDFIVINLKRSKFDVIEAETGEEALCKFAKNPDIDVAILDVMLPGIDGFEVCRKIREKNKTIGIIMLTAKGQELDKVKGLSFGADDYIVKPFSPVELVARVDALLRRVQQVKPNSNKKEIVAGPFKMDLKAMRLLKNGKKIDLTQTEFCLMRLFLENQDKAFSRDEILDNIWGKDYFGNWKTVDVNIRRLRQKVEDNSSDPKYIETVWGLGYRWGNEGLL